MRAIKRDKEIIPESRWTPWMRAHLSWLLTPRPQGDGYTLIENYIPPEEN